MEGMFRGQLCLNLFEFVSVCRSEWASYCYPPPSLWWTQQFWNSPIFDWKLVKIQNQTVLISTVGYDTIGWYDWCAFVNKPPPYRILITSFPPMCIRPISVHFLDEMLFSSVALPFSAILRFSSRSLTHLSISFGSKSTLHKTQQTIHFIERNFIISKCSIHFVFISSFAHCCLHSKQTICTNVDI